jgi:hypothetical protein
MKEITPTSNHHLHQKRLFSQKQFSIGEKGVMITSSSKGQLSEILVPFEEITSTITSYHKSNFWLLITALSIGFASLLWIYALPGSMLLGWQSIVWIVVILLLLLYFLSREQFWLISLTSNTHIMIWKQLPNATTVTAFIEELYTSRDQYLMKWYGTFRGLLPYESQFEQLKFLYAVGVIDSDTFDQMNSALMGLYEKKSKVIGFRSKRNEHEEE